MTGILAQKLGFQDYHVIEERLCGRTTMFDNPLRDGRCGVKILPAILEIHYPIDLTIIIREFDRKISRVRIKSPPAY